MSASEHDTHGHAVRLGQHEGLRLIAESCAVPAPSAEVSMAEAPLSAPPVLRVIAANAGRHAPCDDERPNAASTWVAEKATHQSLKAALRRVLSYQLAPETASRVDVWFASALADGWIAGVERDVHAVLRLLIEHAMRRSEPGGRIDLVVQEGAAGTRVTLRDRAAEADIGVLRDDHQKVLDARRVADEMGALHEAALRLGARIRAGDGVHRGSPHGLELIAQFPPPFGGVGHRA